MSDQTTSTRVLQAFSGSTQTTLASLSVSPKWNGILHFGDSAFIYDAQYGPTPRLSSSTSFWPYVAQHSLSLAPGQCCSTWKQSVVPASSGERWLCIASGRILPVQPS